MLEPQLEALVEGREDVRIRKIDVGKWGSPIARQCEISSLPTLWLYDGTELVSKNKAQVLKTLSAGG